MGNVFRLQKRPVITVVLWQGVKVDGYNEDGDFSGFLYIFGFVHADRRRVGTNTSGE